MESRPFLFDGLVHWASLHAIAGVDGIAILSCETPGFDVANPRDLAVLFAYYPGGRETPLSVNCLACLAIGPLTINQGI